MNQRASPNLKFSYSHLLLSRFTILTPYVFFELAFYYTCTYTMRACLSKSIYLLSPVFCIYVAGTRAGRNPVTISIFSVIATISFLHCYVSTCGYFRAVPLFIIKESPRSLYMFSHYIATISAK